ncbi:hypothetical protein SFRURICE_002314 [Spodoptera frugiperda]|nr:hypothetical protein SFRURICE_002314 [Spodoptera frugiperda]
MGKSERKKRQKRTAIFSCLTRTKSIIESIRVSISSIYNIYVGFCMETTLHGLKHTVEKKLHWLERLLWLFLTLSAFGGAVYCALTQYFRYNSEPVVVSLQRDYRGWWTTFPAVTACFLDRVQPDKARELVEDTWNVTEESDPEKYQYYYEFIELIADVSFRENLQNFWKYQTDDTVKGIDLLDLALTVHPSSVLQVIVSNNDHEVHWNPVMTEVGMCLTFNSMYAEFQHMLQEVDWTPFDLLQCHYHSGRCSVRIDSMNNAVRYFIHSPYEISTAISNPTGEVLPGEELIIDYKASPSVKTLRPEQRRCKYPDEWISDSIRAYSFSLCQMHCRSRMAVMFCGCRPYFHVKGDGDVCDAHGMACIGRNVEILINIPKNLAKCTCLPQCAELNYYSHTKTILVRITRWHHCAICRGQCTDCSGNCPLYRKASGQADHQEGGKRQILPFGLDVGLVGFAAYYLTKLKKPEPQNVLSIFGPDPWGKESQQHPEKVVRCIAHRGAALDAPENTMEALKYCVEHDCNIIELDVRASRDGKLILLHDEGLERLTGTDISSVRTIDWDRIKDIDVGSTHPNRKQFKDVRLCLLDDALDYLLANNVKIIIDVKGEDKQVIAGILSAYASRPTLYQHAAVTCFNPFVLYQIRRNNPDIVGALSYRPFGDNLALHGLLRAADAAHALLWRWAARWCSVSAVLLHKDIVSA